MIMARAVFAGVAGAFAMSVAALVFGELGIAISFEGLLAELLGLGTTSQIGWMAGFLFHLMLGGWFAVVYAVGFERLNAGGWCIGAAFSILHILIAGFALAYLAPFVTPGSWEPTIFMAHEGMSGVCTFILLHLTYGAVVGFFYKALRTPVYAQHDGLKAV